ncbi:MAG TPA: hypothetical protein VK760_11975 [Candidatus Acidoferrales bacterium]|nr:hypothetical protein [Candidatus Acidoferrales bacterium]
MIYRHEQVGRIYIALLGFLAVVCIVVAITTHSTSLALMLGAILVLVCISFARLSIEVDRSGLRWGMTFGIPGGYIPMEEIVSVDIVPVAFWYGIGIHLTLRGWVWNVALGRGVQIHRCGGMPIVLGTDEPEALVAAIGRGRSG